jgi:hypothetical protein
MKKELVPLFPHLIPVEERTVDTIIRAFGERVEDVNESIQERIEQYMRYLQQARPDDWFEWGLRGVSQVATKVTKEQRSIAYLIGIYKTWLTYGFGTYHSAEFAKVKELFKQRFGLEPSVEAAAKLNQLIGDWGMVFTVAALMNIQPPPIQDVSLIITNSCEQYMESNYKPIEIRGQGV